MEYILGSEEILNRITTLQSKRPFSEDTIEFCQTVSKQLVNSPLGRTYPDIITLGFWLRKGSILEFKQKYYDDQIFNIGRGVIFHVAPSNVPVNFAYSLFTGILCGNANVVKIPSKDFPQISVIVDAIKIAINKYDAFKDRICLVRYGHNQSDNDYFSSICDVRVIWGGDNTISEIRKSPMPPRSIDVTFADRYSFAVIDIKEYFKLEEDDKNKFVRRFYNDTYLTDQNACTSPKLIYWYRYEKEFDDIRNDFWDRLWAIVRREYNFQDIQGIDKLTNGYLFAAKSEDSYIKRILSRDTDNRLVRIESGINTIKREFFGNSGYFLEIKGKDIGDLTVLCDDKHCQTISYLGKKEMFDTLIEQGIKGVDRIVPIGKTMDFDFMWDGYNLIDSFTRKIQIL